METTELEQKTHSELLRIARALIKQAHFRLYISDNETREKLIDNIRDMQRQLGVHDGRRDNPTQTTQDLLRNPRN